MSVSPNDQPPPADFSAVEWVLIVITSAVLALLIVVVMAVATLLSVTGFLLASPFFLLDERRHRRSFGHPLWDASLDSPHEPGVGEKAGAIDMGQPGSAEQG
jgi:hypothetical protein